MTTRRVSTALTAIALVVITVWFARNSRWEVVWLARWLLLRGLLVSWEVTVVSVGVGLVSGILLAAARLYGPPALRIPAILFIELVRAIPQIMVIFWVFFGTPALTGQTLEPMPAALVSLSVVAAAYLAEVIRAGLQSVSKIHRESGYAAGLRSDQVFVDIVLPQALRTMLPALIANVVMMFKTTSLVYLIGLVDFFRAVILINNRAFAPGALYLTLAVGYFVCNWALSLLIRRFDPRYALTA